MTIHAGDLQARLTVTKTELVDRPDGGQEPGVVDVLVNVPASVVPISADEQIRLGTQLATATYRAHLRMPYDAAGQVVTITPAMSATSRHGYTGQVQTFTIAKATDVDGRGRELELVLEERVT
jgi:head-tail adaptor